MLNYKNWSLATGGVVLSLVTSFVAPSEAATVFSGSGAGTTDAFNNFQTAIGGGNRINWDGVALDGTDINPNTQVIDLGTSVAIPVDRFRGQGAIYADPYVVSGDGFASVNPATTGQFPAFSPNNTFAMFDFNSGQFDDRFIEQTFVVPGTDITAATRGFGAIFVDVEDPTSSSIEYFGTGTDGSKVSLGKFFVPTGESGETQFLGVLFDEAVVTEVQLTLGTNALFSFDGTTLQSFGDENLSNGVDLAVTDDFLFATPTTPVLVAVPEPIGLPVSGIAVLGLVSFLTRRKRS